MTIKKPDKWDKWEFENSRMKKSLPEDIVSDKVGTHEDEEFASFLLSLAMIFNDLKDLVVIHDTFQYLYKSELVEVNEHFGERGGIIGHIVKLMHSTLHETLVFIYESEEVMQSEKFRKLMARVPIDTQNEWDLLCKVARKEPINDQKFHKFAELRNSLEKLRNNVGFHFQTKKQLLAGYRRYFFGGLSNTPADSRKFAYRSVGSDFNRSRYYYVDAALQGYFVNLFGDENSTRLQNDQVLDLTKYIVYAIHDILSAYHDALPNR